MSGWSSQQNPWSSNQQTYNGFQYYDQQAADAIQANNNCIDTSGCASGFSCINGQCMRVEELASEQQEGGCGTWVGGDPTTDVGGCGGGSVGRGPYCTTSSPGDCLPTKPSNFYSSCGYGGGGGSGGRPSFGGGGNYVDSPDGSECDVFCDGWRASFGSPPGAGCPPPCGDCLECSIFGSCKKPFDAGCSCDSGAPSQCAKCGRDGDWIMYDCGSPPRGPGKPASGGCFHDNQCPDGKGCSGGQCVDVSSGQITFETQCWDLIAAHEGQSCAQWTAGGGIFGPQECVACSESSSGSLFASGVGPPPPMEAGNVGEFYSCGTPQCGCCVPCSFTTSSVFWQGRPLTTVSGYWWFGFGYGRSINTYSYGYSTRKCFTADGKTEYNGPFDPNPGQLLPDPGPDPIDPDIPEPAPLP